MRLHRLLGIIMLLDSRGIMKAKNLAQVLETSERTIYRDIDTLCESGFPIVSILGPKGGYSFIDGYKMNSNTLESQDAVTLLLSSMGIRPEKNTEMDYQLKNAMIKLENSVAQEHKEEIIKAKEKFFVDSEPWWRKNVENSNIQNSNVDLIKKSILKLKKLGIHYRKFDGTVSERVIRPYGAIIKNSEWYVAAFCELKNEVRVFKCNRIENIEVTDGIFTMHTTFDLESFWENNKQQFVRQTLEKVEDAKYIVTIKLEEEKKEILDGFHTLTSLKSEDGWIYDMDMISFKTACNIIFPLSDRVEVLEPTELRLFLLEKCNKILNLYKSK